MDVSEVSLQATGNKKIIFLCDRVNKNDIQIKLTQHNPETRDIIWEHTVDQGLVKPCRFGGLSFFAPAYRDPEITQPVQVSLTMYRPSDRKSSEPVTLTYLPVSVSSTGSSPNPRVMSSFSLPVMPADPGFSTIGSPSQGNLDQLNLPHVISTLDEYQGDQRMTNLKSTVTTLTRVLNAEKEANRHLSQRSLALQKDLETARTDAKLLELQLKTAKGDKESLVNKSEELQGKIRELELKCMEMEHSRTFFGSNETFLATLEAERERTERLRSENSDLTLQLAESRRAHETLEKGVGNMKWQLEQKEQQLAAVEEGLRGTFPVTGSKRGAGGRQVEEERSTSCENNNGDVEVANSA